MKVQVWVKVVDWQVHCSMWDSLEWEPVDYDELRSYYESDLYEVRVVR